MNRLSKEQQKKIMAIAIGTVVAIVVLYLGLISYQQSALELARKRVAEGEKKIEAASKLIKSAQDWQKAVDIRKAMLDEIETNMVSGDPFSWIIRVVTKFKAPYRIDTPNFSPAQSVPVGIFPSFPYQAVLFKVKAFGNYHEYGKFLAEFENQFPYMRVQNINLEPAKTSAAEESENLEINMEIVALIKPVAAR